MGPSQELRDKGEYFPCTTLDARHAHRNFLLLGPLLHSCAHRDPLLWRKMFDHELSPCLRAVFAQEDGIDEAVGKMLDLEIEGKA